MPDEDAFGGDFLSDYINEALLMTYLNALRLK
jgi:hypothetical protein